MIRRRTPRFRVLVVSPSTRGGSWRWIEEAIRHAGLTGHTSVVAYGRGCDLSATGCRSMLVPFLPYERVGLWMSRHPASITLYNFPLVLALFTALLRWRPRVIMANGIVLAIAATPYARMARAELILAYHSYLSHRPPWVKRLVSFALRGVDHAFVNSKGSELDLGSVVPATRIHRIEHWADDVYFNAPLAPRPTSGSLRILYVGRQDNEKVGFLLDVVERCKDDPVEFTLVGTGPLADRVRSLAQAHPVRALGYVEDKKHLADLYADAHVLWGMADDSYVAKPVVEGFACGLPVIIPDVPAVDGRASRGVRIPHDLVPPSIGWIIDGRDADGARRLLLDLADALPDRGVECREYAMQHHSKRNLDRLVATLHHV